MKLIARISKFFLLHHSLDGGEGGGGGGAGDGGQGGGGGGTGTPPAFNAREHLADDGTFKPDWHKAAGVSEAIGRKFTRPEALARSYETLEAQIGKKGIIVPGPNATAQERDAFYSALGRPAKPEEYGFAKPDKIRVGDKELAVPDTAWSADRAKAWQQTLHELGVPKDVAQKIMLKATEESVTGLDAIAGLQAKSLADAKAAMKTEWGADFDANLGGARRVAEQFGGEEMLNHPALGNDPVLMRFLAKVAAATKERPGANLRESGGNNNLTPAEARAKGEQLTKQIQERSRADRNWANGAEAKQMKEEKSRMFAIAHPN